MKCTIELDSGSYIALEKIALLDSDENLLVIPGDAILCAIDIFLRIRSLPLDKQELIAETIEYED